MSLTHCKEESDSKVSSFSSQGLTNNIIDNIIVGSLEELDIASAEFQSEARFYRNNQTDFNLERLKTKYQNLLEKQETVSIFKHEFPSIKSVSAQTGAFPANEEGIKAKIYEASDIDSLSLLSAISTEKSIYALEYLLYHLTQNKKRNPQKIAEYVYFLAEHISQTHQKIYKDWTPEGRNYPLQYRNMEQENFSIVKKIVSTLYKKSYQVLNRYLALPLGGDVPESANPAYIVGKYSNSPVKVLLQAYNAMKLVINGSTLGQNRYGLDDYIDHNSENKQNVQDSLTFFEREEYENNKIHKRINNQIEDIKALLWQINYTDERDFTGRYSIVREVYDKHKVLHEEIKEMKKLIYNIESEQIEARLKEDLGLDSTANIDIIEIEEYEEEYEEIENTGEHETEDNY